MEMDIVQDLKLSKSLVLQHFDLPATALLWSYGEGKWNIRQLLIHIVDAETVLYDRIRRIISEQPNSLIWAFDQDAWAAHLDYHTFPLEISKQIFTGVREGVIHLAERYYVSHGDLPFVHSQTGIRTLRDEMDKVAWHCRGHLAQIEVALGRGF